MSENRHVQIEKVPPHEAPYAGDLFRISVISEGGARVQQLTVNAFELSAISVQTRLFIEDAENSP